MLTRLDFVFFHWYRITDSLGEVLKGVRCYFDKALPVLLLYNKEREQYHELVIDNVSPSTIYGAEHLLRLFGMSRIALSRPCIHQFPNLHYVRSEIHIFYMISDLFRLFIVFTVKLPELLAYVNIEDETQTRLHQKLLDFLKYHCKLYEC